MKKIVSFILFAVFIAACTPDKYEFREMGMADMDDVREIKLRISHYQLLADGKAQLEFSPLFITKDGFEVLKNRIDYSQIEYRTLSGELLPGKYTTSDQALIGKKIEVYARIKGKDLVSDTVSFTVTDPSAAKVFPEITIPIVFHLIQSDEEINGYGGKIPMERIHLLLDKINHTFSGAASYQATGVDTKIRFKAALYDPYGNKLLEPGINRVYVKEVADKAKDQYTTLITNEKALWPYDKYLNVWLISDLNKEYKTFYYTISTHCIPRYVSSGTYLSESPQGLQWSVLPENWTPVPQEVGILYRLQSIFTMTRSFGEKEENELVNGLGYYLGLLPTWGTKSGKEPDDYCTDTHRYYGSTATKYNITTYKSVEDYYFMSENIMDDPTGVHRSVSLQQSIRAHWVLQNCPERCAWKSDYAFTGK